MKNVLSIGRDIPGLASKPKKTNRYTLEASKNWLGEFVVKAIAPTGECAAEKVLRDRGEFERWLDGHFGRRESNRLFPSDIETIVKTAEQGEKAEFPITVRPCDTQRYGFLKPV